MSDETSGPAQGAEDETPGDLVLDGALWRFALAVYARPGVAAACLALQDEGGVDVIHLLQVIFADVVLGRPLSASAIRAAQSAMTAWRDATVLPLRALRRSLKAPRPDFPPDATEALRGDVKRIELKAEQVQLALAEQWLAHEPAGIGLPLRAALEQVIACSGGAGATHDATLDVLLAAAAEGNPNTPPAGRAVPSPSNAQDV